MKSPDSKDRTFLSSQNQVLFLCLFFILTSAMTFYLGAKYGRRVLVFLNHEEARPADTFLPDETAYNEIRQILSESDKNFNFHNIVAENNANIPLTPVAKSASSLNEKPTATAPDKAVAKADPKPITPKVLPDPVALTPTKSKPDVGSLIASELEGDKDAHSVQEPVTTIPSPVAVRPVARYKLQIGSYADRDRALKARQEWQSRGYNVELFETRIPGKGLWYRLHLGGFESRESAMETQRALLTRFHQTAMVLAQ